MLIAHFSFTVIIVVEYIHLEIFCWEYKMCINKFWFIYTGKMESYI